MLGKAFIRACRVYGQCLRDAFGEAGKRAAPLRLRRLVFTLLVFPAFLGLQAVHWVALVLDEVLFPGYREARLRRPLIITGVPRSGTTFLHRALAVDTGRYAPFATWEAIFAPAICERYVVEVLTRVDGWVGSPVKRVLRWATGKATGAMSDIHAVGLEASEEDYLTLLPVGGCFITALAFPQTSAAWIPGTLDAPEYEQDAEVLVGFYVRMLQRHQYFHGPEKRILSKNAAFASWVPALADALPEATFLLCVRDPLTGLSSQLSSIRDGCAGAGVDFEAAGMVQHFTAFFAHGYATLQKTTRDLAPKRFAMVDQAAMRADALAEVRRALAAINEPCADVVAAALTAVEDKPIAAGRSAHRHGPEDFGLSAESLDPAIFQAYRELLREKLDAGDENGLAPRQSPETPASQ